MNIIFDKQLGPFAWDTVLASDVVYTTYLNESAVWERFVGGFWVRRWVRTNKIAW